MLDGLQMPNTVNAKNPMPTNSTTTATKSYSSQRIDAKIGGHLAGVLGSIVALAVARRDLLAAGLYRAVIEQQREKCDQQHADGRIPTRRNNCSVLIWCGS